MSLKEDLKRIRRIMEQEFNSSGFPKDFCWAAAMRINRLLGFQVVSGAVKELRLEECIGGYYHHGHYWNYDPKTDNYMDITLDQFDFCKKLGPVVITPKNSELAQKIYTLI